MESLDNYKLIDFETYCMAMVELDWYKRRQLGILPEYRIELILDALRKKLMSSMDSEPEAEVRGKMIAIIEIHVSEYSKCLRRM